MRVITVEAPCNKQQTDRLVRFCRDLDGTEIEVLRPVQPGWEYGPHLAAWAFYQACRESRTEPFLWIEPDCSPLVAGWLDFISSCYERKFNDGWGILLPYPSKTIHDTASGIAVYPRGILGALPELEFFRNSNYGWDWWVEDHLRGLIKRTSLIQHSYGIYNHERLVKRHRFPRDLWGIRPNAVLFHSDKKQELLMLHEKNDEGCHIRDYMLRCNDPSGRYNAVHGIGKSGEGATGNLQAE